MECYGARNMTSSTMAVFTNPNFMNYTIRQQFSVRQHRRYSNFSLSSSLKRIKCSGKREMSLVVEDEEDYVKAGGSELLFVQMQQNKSMDTQSKLSEKVNC